MKFKTTLGLASMALVAMLMVRPVWAAQLPGGGISLGTSATAVPITSVPIMPQSNVRGVQTNMRVAQRRRAARNIIGGAAAGAIIGGIIGGRRGARAGAVIGGVSGAVRASKRPRYRKWRRGDQRRWRERRRY